MGEKYVLTTDLHLSNMERRQIALTFQNFLESKTDNVIVLGSGIRFERLNNCQFRVCRRVNINNAGSFRKKMVNPLGIVVPRKSSVYVRKS